MVEPKRVELLTPCVQGRCSKPTELRPQIMKKMAELTRLELATFRVTGGRSNQLSYSSNNLLDIFVFVQ